MSERMNDEEFERIKRTNAKIVAGLKAAGDDMYDADEDVTSKLVSEIDALRAELAKAERERDSAREEARKADAALSPLDAVVHHLGIEDSFTEPVEAIKQIERERDEARAALAQAREAALEQAARACETLTGSDATPTLRPGARMCLHRIRALKSTPTQESETP